MIRLLALVAAFVSMVAAPATAATISIVSMQYSAAHPVPHIHYEGETADGDIATLQGIYDTFVKCRISCLGPDGGSTAVLTLNGPGGSYIEGLGLADFLRANHIATVVERGAYCYSACAFAFLGGSGYSSQEGIGDYIDRMVEPGSIVGFHAPYADEDSFTNALKERGAMAAQGDTRDSLALMVKELVKWNVDPLVMYQMMGKGPDESFDLVHPEDLYLTRVSLPPTPTKSWISDIPSAVRNVCERLLAIDERAELADVGGRFLSDYTEQIGKTEYSTISGYKLGDRPLSIGSCAATDESLKTDGDYEIALYFTPGIEGYNSAGLSFFNRQQGWSSAGTGSNPVKRILQKGPMNSYFLPAGVNIDDLDLPGEEEIDRNRFKMTLPPLMGALPDDAVIDATDASSRISHIGNVFIFERVGPALLFDSALAVSSLGRTYSNEASSDVSFVRDGTFDDTGANFSWFGFKSGDTSTVVEAIYISADGSPATQADLDTLSRIECSMGFDGLMLDCQ